MDSHQHHTTWSVVCESRLRHPNLVALGLPLALSRGFAHSMQNLAVREFSVSQEGQRRVNGEAHSSQNFARSGFSAPHFEQRIAAP